MMRPTRSRWPWFAVLGAIAVTAGACPQSAASRGELDGEVLYVELCSRCHGPGGQPTPSMVARHGVKDLTTSKVQAEMSDEDIRQQILRGSDNRQMPAFGGAISDEQVDAVVDYVRTLSD